MKKGVRIFFIALAFSFAISFFINMGNWNYDLLTAIGLVNLVIGFLMLLMAGIFLLAKNKPVAQSYAIAAGFLLLTGTLTCTAFPLKLRMM